jgi:UDP-N-acetylglucosamine 2-epimerase (non-hydrolysing)
VAGARPNFVKIAPIMRAIDASGVPDRSPALRPHLVHTGQHYDRGLSQVFFDELRIPPPEANLGVGSDTHARQTAAVMTAFEDYCNEAKPDTVVVVGDVNSTLACSLVAAKMGIPLAHVEAGLRSFDRRMPEEINRMVTDRLADLLFVTEPSGVENLRSEGVEEEKIQFVGNVMIDTLHDSLRRLEEQSLPAPPERPYGLMTLHRPSNVDDRETLGRLLDLLCEFSGELPLLFPVHPRTTARLEEFGFRDRLQWREGLQHLDGVCGLIGLPPIGYLEFLNLMRSATLVLTDSGGIQEETTVLGVPCITLRENTERPVTVTEGTNYLVGSRERDIRAAFEEALSGGKSDARVPELWDGKTAERIVEVLTEDAARRLAAPKRAAATA